MNTRHHTDTAELDPTTKTKTVTVILTNDGMGCYEHDGKVFYNKDSIGFHDGIFGEREPKRLKVTIEPIND